MRNIMMYQKGYNALPDPLFEWFSKSLRGPHPEMWVQALIVHFCITHELPWCMASRRLLNDYLKQFKLEKSVEEINSRHYAHATAHMRQSSLLRRALWSNEIGKLCPVYKITSPKLLALTYCTDADVINLQMACNRHFNVSAEKLSTMGPLAKGELITQDWFKEYMLQGVKVLPTPDKEEDLGL